MCWLEYLTAKNNNLMQFALVERAVVNPKKCFDWLYIKKIPKGNWIVVWGYS